MLVSNWDFFAYKGYGQINPDDIVSVKVAYIGEFKNGYKDGYGIEYQVCESTRLLNVVYEGKFSKGKYDGDGIEYNTEALDDAWVVQDGLRTYMDVYESLRQSTEKGKLEIPLVARGVKLYEGKFKKGLWEGKGKLYWCDIEDIYSGQSPAYEGGFKGGSFSGDGTSYFRNGEIQYKGGFKYGKYSGKGVLYDENGNVLHKGKFRGGTIY